MISDSERPVITSLIKTPLSGQFTASSTLPLEIWSIIAEFVSFRPKNRFRSRANGSDVKYIDLHYERQRDLCRLAASCRNLLTHLTPLLYQYPVFHRVSPSSSFDQLNLQSCIRLFLYSINSHASVLGKANLQFPPQHCLLHI